MRVFFDKYDLLLTPTLPCTAFKAGQGVPDQFPIVIFVSCVLHLSF